MRSIPRLTCSSDQVYLVFKDHELDGTIGRKVPNRTVSYASTRIVLVKEPLSKYKFWLPLKLIVNFNREP